MRRRPHVLLLGMQFPPARGSGVYRIRAWANQLAKHGLDVTVLAANRKYWLDMSGDLDEELAQTVDPRVRVVEVAIPHEHIAQDVRNMSWLHANFPKAYSRGHEYLRDRIFPEVYALVLPVFAAHALRLRLGRKIDLVLATGNPYAQYGAAYRIAQLLHIPYVVDYHDPWTLDLWKENDAFPPGHPAFAWEKRIIDGASLVVTINKPLVEWYRSRYPQAAQKVRLVENGFADDIVRLPTFKPIPDSQPLRFGFLGTIRQDLPLTEYLDGWELGRKEPELADATMDFFGYLGFFRSSARGLRDRIEAGEPLGIRYRGPVSQTSIASVFEQIDVMSMLLTSSRYVTAGKGFDYMASGRPVVGVHDPRNDTTDLFKNYPLFFGVESVSPEGIRDSLVAAGRAARSQTVAQFEQCLAEALRHTWDIAMAPVVAEVEEIAGG